LDLHQRFSRGLGTLCNLHNLDLSQCNRLYLSNLDPNSQINKPHLWDLLLPLVLCRFSQLDLLLLYRLMQLCLLVLYRFNHQLRLLVLDRFN
jgi:hypothetical protein